uniref:Uncharacterized protein n=1 Tax=Candidatus Kentrum sp. DK TaxID=2126562 RepID=A0A450SQ88_9GAMM|nr:MAG: hypothetical protein BECKDK2373C_GA0170839_10527 [Candidatus Kentron sp. DK]
MLAQGWREAPTLGKQDTINTTLKGLRHYTQPLQG